jgi:hypothetical protein
MTRKKHAEKEFYWREIVNRQAVSGLSIRRFCANEGISQPSFYAWRKKFREREKDGTRAGNSGGRVDEPSSGGEFIPLKLLDSGGALEVIHPLGYQVRVSGEVNLRTLQQVLDVLDRRGGQ